MRRLIAVALIAFAGVAGAQSASYTPSAAEVKQSRENTKRDQKMADAMEKARLKEEAKPAPLYVPPKKVVAKEEDKDRKPQMAKPKKPQYFSAVSPRPPVEKKKKKKEEA